MGKKPEHHPALKKLFASPSYQRIMELASKGVFRRPTRSDTAETAVWHAALRGALGPSHSERLTKQERLRLANSLRRSATELRETLKIVLAGGVPFQFQANLDGLALDATNSFAETFEEQKRGELEEGDHFNTSRFAIYHLLMDGLPELLETIVESAEWWGSQEQYLAKPNHPNAERLYFIRRATETFYLYFGQPMRELTLELTSVYFDCSDLSEADLSRLAPVRSISHPLLRTAE